MLLNSLFKYLNNMMRALMNREKGGLCFRNSFVPSISVMYRALGIGKETMESEELLPKRLSQVRGSVLGN